MGYGPSQKKCRVAVFWVGSDNPKHTVYTCRPYTANNVAVEKLMRKDNVTFIHEQVREGLLNNYFIFIIASFVEHLSLNLIYIYEFTYTHLFLEYLIYFVEKIYR